MKKIDKSSLPIVFTVVSCLILIIGIFLTINGVEAGYNERQAIEKVNDMNKVNNLLQDNYDKIKKILNDNENKNQEDKNQEDIQEIDPNVLPSPNYYESKEDFDIMLGTYLDDKYPTYFDAESIRILEMYGLDSFSLKHAYELKLRIEGYPAEFNGVAELEKIRYIDATTCLVQLGNEDLDMKLIYSLLYDQGGIVFEEIKRTISEQESYSPANFMWKSNRNYIHYSSRYRLSDWELIDSEMVLGNTNISYSPNGKYSIISLYHRPDNYEINEWNTHYQMIVKDTETDEVIYKDMVPIGDSNYLTWYEDSTRFIVGNNLFYDMDNIKRIDLNDEDDDEFILRSIDATNDYICRVYSTYDHLNNLTKVKCKIYDWNNNYIKDIPIFDIDSNTSIYDYFDFKCVVSNDNNFHLYFMTETSSVGYMIDINGGSIKILEDYVVPDKYIPELGWTMIEDKNAAKSEYAISFKDNEGEVVATVNYNKSLKNNYLGIDLQQKCLYFTNMNNNFDDDSILGDFHIIVYHYDEQVIEELPLPIDHLGESEIVNGAIMMTNYISNGIVEIVSYIPLEIEN